MLFLDEQQLHAVAPRPNWLRCFLKRVIHDVFAMSPVEWGELVGARKCTLRFWCNQHWMEQGLLLLDWTNILRS